MQHIQPTWLSVPGGKHSVYFYHSENDLLLRLTQYVSSGLKEGKTCVVIATHDHTKSLNQQLKQSGLDLRAAKDANRYQIYDAEETLAQFMVDDLPDRERFFHLMETIIFKKATTNKKPIQAYGEMVAVLWKRGQARAVIELENLWNELGTSHRFSLFCAYPELHFVMDHAMREHINNTHNVSLASLAVA